MKTKPTGERLASTRDDPEEKIWSVLQAPQGKFRVTSYDWFDGDIFAMADFDTYEEAVAFAEKHTRDTVIFEIYKNREGGAGIHYKGLEYAVRDDTGKSLRGFDRWCASVADEFIKASKETLLTELRKALRGHFRVFGIVEFTMGRKYREPHILFDFESIEEAKHFAQTMNEGAKKRTKISVEYKVYNEEGCEV